MTPKEFNKLLEYFIERKKKSLGVKSSEYAKDNDRLYNFKRAGEILRCTPEKALWGMFIKHLVSLQDIVEDIENGKYPTVELLEEKCKDAGNYIDLLEALIREKLYKGSVYE